MDSSATFYAGSSRQKILDLAVDALGHGGENAIRVNDIAAQADVAVTSLYHFFGNREGLIVAAQVARFRRAAVEEFHSARAAVDQCTSVANFRALMEARIRHFFESPVNQEARRVRLQTYASGISRPEVARLLAEDLEAQGQRMQEFLEPLKTKGWIKPDTDTRTFGAWYHGVMMGHVLYEVGSPHFDEEVWIRMTVTALLQIVTDDNGHDS